MTSSSSPLVPQRHLAAPVHVLGLPVSDSAVHLLRELAGEAHLHTVHVTSVHRSVVDQARIFFSKHVAEGKPARYKNPQVAAIVAHAQTLYRRGQGRDKVQAYLIDAIEHIHGGPASVSTHIGTDASLEVFDVAHYSGPTSGVGRRNFMTHEQAHAFLGACRRRMPWSIS